MQIANMKNDGNYEMKRGMYKGFTINRETSDNKTTYTIATAKKVFERNQKLYLTIEKSKDAPLSEEDIANEIVKTIVGDALCGFYDSLPAIPTNFWFKKMLPDKVYEEFRSQAKPGVDYDKAYDMLMNTVDAVKKSATPTPYEKPAVEKVK